MVRPGEDTGVDDRLDSCCQRWPVSAGDARNALAVLRDWLECNAAGVESPLGMI